jgi:hypothetical protein
MFNIDNGPLIDQEFSIEADGGRGVGMSHIPRPATHDRRRRTTGRAEKEGSCDREPDDQGSGCAQALRKLHECFDRGRQLGTGELRSIAEFTWTLSTIWAHLQPDTGPAEERRAAPSWRNAIATWSWRLSGPLNIEH